NNGISIVGTDKQHVLFNFPQATTLNTNGIGINGSLLAPLAAVNFASGNIDGTLIAQSVSNNGEAHNLPFQGNLHLTAVPEPASLALMLLGGVGLAVRARRRRAG